MEKTKRIQWMDGLKGLSCVLIFAHHFLLMFYPAVHFGETVPSHLSGWDTALSQSPFSVIFNGNYLVSLFLTVSGAVISLQILGMKQPDKLPDLVAKRYFRLMLPLLPVGLWVYLSLRFGWFTHASILPTVGSPWASAYYLAPISFGEFLRSALIDTWFVGDARLSNAFWMLATLFFGTFLSVLLATVARRYRKTAWVFLGIAAVGFFNAGEMYLSFVLGTLLAWIYAEKPRLLTPVAGWMALLMGLFLGGYPSGVVATNIYRHLPRLTYIQWHMIGGGLTVYGIWSCGILQKMLSFSLFQWLGKLCYAVYLIHIPLLFSLSPLLFRWTEALGYTSSAATTFALTLAALIALSYLYQRYVERACGWLQGRLFGFLSKREQTSR